MSAGNTNGADRDDNNQTKNDAIGRELDELAARHGASKTRMKNILRPKHAREEFVDDSIFCQFARAVCQANCVWRKELLEAWAVALFVHAHFPGHINRFVDCASGHGLLAWAILVLQLLDGSNNNNSDDGAENDTTNYNNKTAICVDVNMPKAADIVAAAMVEHFPQLEHCVDYVEAKLETIIPSSSTMIVGVHCCALLSDKVVTLALTANAPLILVPCCHSKKSLTANAEKALLKTKGFNVTEYIDQKRMNSLRAAHFEVQDAILPCVIPPKNKIIIAIPSSLTATATFESSASSSSSEITPTCQPCTPSQEQQQQQAAEYYQTEGTNPQIPSLPLPPLIEPDRISWIPAKQRIAIPVADTLDDREVVKELAGRAASHQRMKAPPPSIGFSMFLPPDKVEVATAEFVHATLFASPSNAANTSSSTIRVEDKQLRKKPVPSKYKKITKTFLIHYPEDMDLEQAKAIHLEACEKLSQVIDGAVPRYTEPGGGGGSGSNGSKNRKV